MLNTTVSYGAKIAKDAAFQLCLAKSVLEFFNKVWVWSQNQNMCKARQLEHRQDKTGLKSLQNITRLVLLKLKRTTGQYFILGLFFNYNVIEIFESTYIFDLLVQKQDACNFSTDNSSDSIRKLYRRYESLVCVSKEQRIKFQLATNSLEV